MASVEAGANNGSAVDARESLKYHLAEAGLDTQRFVDLTEGSKRSYTDHTDPANQYEISDLTGNCGVMAGNGLVIIDIDTYREGTTAVPGWIEELPDTYTVVSPHGGEHRYYAIDGSVANITEDWGELRAENQYVVGPGSVLNGCDKDWHDCSKENEGQYTGHVRPIAPISAEALPIEKTGAAEGSDTGNVPEDTETDLAGIDADFDVEQRFEKAMKCAYGEKLTALWEGQYCEAGYGTDRSAAETALAAYLGWWMNNNREVVASLMTRSNAEKWAERGESYRESVLDTACDHSQTYEPSTSSSVPLPYEERPDVGWPCIERVTDALLELGTARTQELVEHDRVNRSERQVQRALDFLLEADQVRSTRNGRQILYQHALYSGE